MKFIRVKSEAGLIVCIRKENIESIYQTKTGSWILYHISKSPLQSEAFTIDASVNIDDLLKEISGDEPTPKKAKLRPMSEAPINKKIIVKGKDGEEYMATALDESPIGLGRYVIPIMYESSAIKIDEFIGWTELPEVME